MKKAKKVDEKERVAAENDNYDKDIMDMLSTFTQEQLIKALEIVLTISDEE